MNLLLVKLGVGCKRFAVIYLCTSFPWQLLLSSSLASLILAGTCCLTFLAIFLVTVTNLKGQGHNLLLKKPENIDFFLLLFDQFSMEFVRVELWLLSLYDVSS